MRIYGPNGTALAAPPTTARRSASGSFSVREQEAPRNSSAAGSLRAIATVDALIALQGMPDPTERKKRAIVKGRNALDVLDTLKLGLLDARADEWILARLRVGPQGRTRAPAAPGP